MFLFILIILILYSVILKLFVFKKDVPYIYYRDIPSEDTPAFVGKVTKGHVDGNDIISTILDLCYRGHISITIENIRGRNKRILHRQKTGSTIDLQEHELFLINQIFKNNYSIIFDDYIKSKKFKKDFKAFDKMLDRRVERKSIFKNSLLKNINKIIFLTTFLIFGIFLFYSMILPITSLIFKPISLNIEIIVLSSLTISSIIFLIISYNYISYINKSTSTQENINLRITYIVLIIIFSIILIVGKVNNIASILYSEMIWYKMTINFILSIIILLYIFNIIKHHEKGEYWYYFFIIVSTFSIILNLKIAMCMLTIFFATYIFFESPKHTNLKDNDYIYKWESFKKYLEDYSMLSKQEENAILIWEKYLIYAVSLGINKKIIKHYSKLNNTVLIDEQYLKRFYIEYLD